MHIGGLVLHPWIFLFFPSPWGSRWNTACQEPVNYQRWRCHCTKGYQHNQTIMSNIYTCTIKQLWQKLTYRVTLPTSTIYISPGNLCFIRSNYTSGLFIYSFIPPTTIPGIMLFKVRVSLATRIGCGSLSPRSAIPNPYPNPILGGSGLLPSNEANNEQTVAF